MSAVLLATTWNGNEPGTLWERLWMHDGDGFCSKLCASGVFVPPTRYQTEDEFWAAYKREAERVHGRISHPLGRSFDDVRKVVG